jgi:hypothetical protein
MIKNIFLTSFSLETSLCFEFYIIGQISDSNERKLVRCEFFSEQFLQKKNSKLFQKIVAKLQ